MEIIKIALGDYPKYEEMLLRKDKFEKEAQQWHDEFVRKFGKYLIDNFVLKLECIRLKKMLAIAQTQINQGFNPDMDEIGDEVNEQMKSFNDDLDNLIAEHQAALDAKVCPEHIVQQVKKIYREIAKVLHPDINAKTQKDPELLDLWNRVSIAYKCNKLEELEELQVLVNTALSKKGIDVSKFVIPNIEEKIQELEKKINEIITTDPYKFKFLLEDKAEVEDMIIGFEEEKKEYLEYKKGLEIMIQDLLER